MLHYTIYGTKAFSIKITNNISCFLSHILSSSSASVEHNQHDYKSNKFSYFGPRADQFETCLESIMLWLLHVLTLETSSLLSRRTSSVSPSAPGGDTGALSEAKFSLNARPSTS